MLLCLYKSIPHNYFSAESGWYLQVLSCFFINVPCEDHYKEESKKFFPILYDGKTVFTAVSIDRFLVVYFINNI